MANKNTKLNIVVDAENRASRGLQSAEKSLSSFGDRARMAGERLQTLGKYGAVAFTAIGAASAKLVQSSAQALQIEESYRRMTEQAEISSNELLKQLQRTSAGTVAATDLMLSANRAMALGVGEDMETMTTLMEIARLKGRSLGLTTTQAFNDIVTGIGRGSPLILDNLGITIKLGEAQEMYAEKLGKTTAELTDAEKKQALLNAVITQGRTELDAAGDVNVTVAEKLQIAKAQFQDTADTLGRTLIPVATRLLEAITPVIEKVAKWIEQNPTLTRNIILAAGAITAMVAVVGLLSAVLLAFNPIAAMIVLAIAGIALIVRSVGKVLEMFGVSWANVWNGIKSVTAAIVDGIVNLVEAMINRVVDGINKFIKLVNKAVNAAATIIGKDLPTIDLLQRVDFGEPGSDNLVNRSFNAAAAPTNVVISGNSFLSEDAAEEMGDLIMNRLKLGSAV